MHDVPPFNKLSLAEDERLSLVAEECAEVIQCIAKIQRHGYESKHPADINGETNRRRLERELGDLYCNIAQMVDSEDVSASRIAQATMRKHANLHKYLHHHRVV